MKKKFVVTKTNISDDLRNRETKGQKNWSFCSVGTSAFLINLWVLSSWTGMILFHKRATQQNTPPPPPPPPLLPSARKRRERNSLPLGGGKGLSIIESMIRNKTHCPEQYYLSKLYWQATFQHSVDATRKQRSIRRTVLRSVPDITLRLLLP